MWTASREDRPRPAARPPRAQDKLNLAEAVAHVEEEAALAADGVPLPEACPGPPGMLLHFDRRRRCPRSPTRAQPCLPATPDYERTPASCRRTDPARGSTRAAPRSRRRGGESLCARGAPARDGRDARGDPAKTTRSGVFLVDIERVRRLHFETDVVSFSERSAAKAGLLNRWPRPDLTTGTRRA